MTTELEKVLKRIKTPNDVVVYLNHRLTEAYRENEEAHFIETALQHALEVKDVPDVDLVANFKDYLSIMNNGDYFSEYPYDPIDHVKLIKRFQDWNSTKNVFMSDYHLWDVMDAVNVDYIIPAFSCSGHGETPNPAYIMFFLNDKGSATIPDRIVNELELEHSDTTNSMGDDGLIVHQIPHYVIRHYYEPNDTIEQVAELMKTKLLAIQDALM